MLLAFGAVVDFLAGRVRRAPKWMADHGLEWAWRLMLEPRRLSRRYLVEDPPELVRLMRRARTMQRGSMMLIHDANPARGIFVAPGRKAAITVVVVTHNSAEDVSRLIDDLRRAASAQVIRVVVVDNRSSDGTSDRVRLHPPDVTLVESAGNLGYAGGINTALPFADPCDAVLILNPRSVAGTRLRHSFDGLAAPRRPGRGGGGAAHSRRGRCGLSLASPGAVAPRCDG